MTTEDIGIRIAVHDQARAVRGLHEVGHATESVGTSATHAAHGTEHLEHATERAEHRQERLKEKMRETVKGMAMFAIGGLAVGGALESVIAGGEKAEVTQKKLEAQVKALGKSSKVSVEYINGLSGALGGKLAINPDDVTNQVKYLTTYKALTKTIGTHNDQFKVAAQLQQDMIARSGMGAQAAAKLIGTIYTSPIQAMGRLNKAGVTLTKAEKENVRQLQLHGEKAKAVAYLMDRLHKANDGAGKANITPQKQLNYQWDMMTRTLGKGLVPFLATFTEKLGEFFKQMRSGEGAGGKFVSILHRAGSLIKLVAGAIKSAFKAGKDLWEGFEQGHAKAVLLVTVMGLVLAVFVAYRSTLMITGLMTAFASGVGGMATGFAAFNAVLRANPLIFVATLIIALGAAFVLAYKHVAWFRRAVDQAWAWIKKTFESMKPTLEKVWAVMKKVFVTEAKIVFAFFKAEVKTVIAVIGWIAKAGRTVAGAFKSAFSGLGGFVAGIFTGIVNAAISVLNKVIGWINTLISAFNAIPGHSDIAAITPIADVGGSASPGSNLGATATVNSNPSQYTNTTSASGVKAATAQNAPVLSTGRNARAGSNGIAPVFHVHIHGSDSATEHITRAVIDRVEVQAASK